MGTSAGQLRSRARRLPAPVRRAARRLLPGRLTRSQETADGGIGEPWRTAYADALLSPLNLHLLDELTQRLERLGIAGDIVECGVYRGGSAAVLGWSMSRLKDGPRKLWLFDSFAGMPPAGERDGEFSHTLEGKFVGSEQRTRELLERLGVAPHQYEIVKGLFAETFPTVATPRTALLHVDCDFYEPVKLSLEKFFPRLTPGGFVVLNDYAVYKGAKAATDEFIAAQELEIELVAIDPCAAFFQKPGNGFSGVPVAGHYPGWPGAVA